MTKVVSPLPDLRYLRWPSLAEGATLILLAFIPFGAFFVTGMFKRKAAAFASQ